MKHTLSRLLAAFLAWAPLMAQATEDPGQGAHLPPLQKIAASHLSGLPSAAMAVYTARDWRPLWTDGQTLTARGKALEQGLRQAGLHGLDPRRYSLPETHDQAAQDIALSLAALRLAEDLRAGVLAPAPAPTASADLTAFLSQLATAQEPATALYALAAPQTPLYTGLLNALAAYRRIASHGGWPRLPDGPLLRPGDTAPALVPLLRQRLRASGDLNAEEIPQNEIDGSIYTLSLENAVRRFQDRHGLDPDGVIGPRTRSALNESVDSRIRTLQLNLDRLRQLPDALGARHVLVNTAGFELFLFQDSQPVFRSPTIVGTRRHPTPSFSDTIEYVVFNPYWNIPRSIAINEIAPQAALDPAYIFREDMQVLAPGGELVNPFSVDWWAAARGDMPYRLRQRPGPQNALGRLKILFPNHFSVYLHDTPARSLFDQRVRAFSHGCVRVARPLELAAQVLGWPVEEVTQKVDQERREWVTVSTPTPVHVTYLTAWVDPETGTIHFRDDIYGRDRAVLPHVSALPLMADSNVPPRPPPE